jgi:hypothetical protein
MITLLKKSALIVLIAVIALLIAKPVFGAKTEPAPKITYEYKVVPELGKRSTITKMEKALDSFENQLKDKAVLEIDLKKYGDDGWMLVSYDRESGYTIFMRPVKQ